MTAADIIQAILIALLIPMTVAMLFACLAVFALLQRARRDVAREIQNKRRER